MLIEQIPNFQLFEDKTIPSPLIIFFFFEIFNATSKKICPQFAPRRGHGSSHRVIQTTRREVSNRISPLTIYVNVHDYFLYVVQYIIGSQWLG